MLSLLFFYFIMFLLPEQDGNCGRRAARLRPPRVTAAAEDPLGEA